MAQTNRFALVTGSSRGIGRAIALELAERGHSVAVHFNTRRDAAERVLAEVRERGADGFTVAADVTQEDHVRRLVERVQAEFGALDVLVHNARPELAEFYRPPMQLGTKAWASALDSQATAFLVAVQAAAPLLRSGARVVAITYSPSTRLGSWQPWSAMGPAKAALESLVRYFAVALGPRQVTVNAISPGFVFGEPGTLDATVINGLPEEAQRAIRDWHEGGWTPMRRLARPAEIGAAVAMLCGPGAELVTGQVLHVDGGASVMDPLAPLAIQHG
ncbi:MAG TPA: SDR family oxidoreductase [Pseudonocardia sp.]|nr:SDR family oxidoreductase [Pseudonocardia sp.]